MGYRVASEITGKTAMACFALGSGWHFFPEMAPVGVGSIG
jgi:hypothetical protein